MGCARSCMAQARTEMKSQRSRVSSRPRIQTEAKAIFGAICAHTHTHLEHQKQVSQKHATERAPPPPPPTTPMRSARLTTRACQAQTLTPIRGSVRPCTQEHTLRFVPLCARPVMLDANPNIAKVCCCYTFCPRPRDIEPDRGLHVQHMDGGVERLAALVGHGPQT